MARLVFLSDVHWTPQAGPQATTFVDLLTSLRQTQDSGQQQDLYVLGDLFAFWVDRPLMIGMFGPVLGALADLSRAGCRVTLLEGNRDFGFGKVLQEHTGARLAGERLVLEHRGHRVLLMHGDQLLTRDRRYQLFKRLVRCAPARWLARLAPSPILLWIVRRMERVSSAEKSRKSPPTMEVDPAAAAREAAAVRADLLIHGHTHRPGRLEVRGPAGALTLFSLGGWDRAGATIVEWPEDGEPGLVDWPPIPPA